MVGVREEEGGRCERRSETGGEAAGGVCFTEIRREMT